MEALTLTQFSDAELRKLIRETLQETLSEHCAVPAAPTLPDLLTIRGASAFLDLAPSTLYGLVHAKEIPYMKRGRRLYFSRDELFSWVRSKRKSTRSELLAQASQYFAERSRSQSSVAGSSSQA